MSNQETENSVAELKAIPVAALRKLVRKQFQQANPHFVANARKDVLLAVLCNEKNVVDAADEWLEDQSPRSQEAALATVEPLAAGDHDGAEKSAILEQLSHLKAINPAFGVYIEDLLLEKKSLAETVVKLTRLLAEKSAENDPEPSRADQQPDGNPQIGGQKLPQIVPYDSSNPDPLQAMVPALDVNYQPLFWRAGNTVGNLEFEHSAEDLARCLINDHRILLCGEKSVGKTSMVAFLCAMCNWPMIRVNFNHDLTVMDFVGSMMAEGGKTSWKDGPLPLAMKSGAVLVMDEFDHAPAECSSIIHSVMEKGGKLLITANHGEVIEPHENFRIVATSNTLGYGDESSLYANAKVQDAALMSRFDVVFPVEWMDKSNEIKLLRKKTGVDRKAAEAIVALANETRRFAGDTILNPIDLRQTLSWAQLTTQGFTFSESFHLAVLAKAQAGDRTAMLEILQRMLGSKLDPNSCKEVEPATE